MKCADILSILKPRLQDLGPVILAGGCVRDELNNREPKDYDCFVCFGRPVTEADRDAITERVQDLLPEHSTGDESGGGFFLLTDLQIRGKPVQVIASPHSNWHDVVDHFDWRICLYAFDGEVRRHAQADQSCECGTLVLHRVEYPISTLRRGFRFCDRLKMFIQTDDLRRLCSEVCASVISEQEIEDPKESLEVTF